MPGANQTLQDSVKTPLTPVPEAEVNSLGFQGSKFNPVPQKPCLLGTCGQQASRLSVMPQNCDSIDRKGPLVTPAKLLVVPSKLLVTLAGPASLHCTTV